MKVLVDQKRPQRLASTATYRKGLLRRIHVEGLRYILEGDFDHHIFELLVLLAHADSLWVKAGVECLHIRRALLKMSSIGH